MLTKLQAQTGRQDGVVSLCIRGLETWSWTQARTRKELYKDEVLGVDDGVEVVLVQVEHVAGGDARCKQRGRGGLEECGCPHIVYFLLKEGWISLSGRAL